MKTPRAYRYRGRIWARQTRASRLFGLLRFRPLQLEPLEERTLLSATAWDEVEPNDTLSTATGLPLVEDPAGSGYWMGRGLGSIQPSSDNDYWSFEALAGDVVSVSVDTPDSDLNPRVYLYDAAGNQLGYDDDAGPSYDAFISHYAIASSGTYYARVLLS